MCAGGTPYRLEIASVSASALLSGYQLTSAAAAVMAFATEGRGPYGLSFEASLNDWPAALATRRPGLYGANWFRTERNRGDRSDTVVLRGGRSGTSLAVCHRRPGQLPSAGWQRVQDRAEGGQHVLGEQDEPGLVQFTRCPADRGQRDSRGAVGRPTVDSRGHGGERDHP